MESWKLDELAPVVYSTLRYTLKRVFRAFMRLPWVSRFFLSISITLCLAVFTLRVIFYFSPPEPAPIRSDSSQQTQSMQSTQSMQPLQSTIRRRKQGSQRRGKKLHAQ